MSKLADNLVAQKSAPWSADFMKDPIQDHLLKLIDSKKSRSVKRGEAPGRPQKVVSIFDALKKSLQEEERKQR